MTGALMKLAPDGSVMSTTTDALVELTIQKK
jgi:hypothetical protein